MYDRPDRDPRLEIAITRWLLDSEVEYKMALEVAFNGNESNQERCASAHRDFMAAYETSNLFEVWPYARTVWA